MRRSIAIAAALLAAACTGAPKVPETPPPPPNTILLVDGNPVPLTEFEDYVASNLDLEGLEEPIPPEDLDRVKSRLFDDFIDEQRMLAEAAQRGILVSDAEVRSWQGDAEPVEDPAKAELMDRRAKRELTVRKLIDAMLAAQPGATEEALREDVRARHRVEAFPEKLPFRYVEEVPPPVSR